MFRDSQVSLLVRAVLTIGEAELQEEYNGHDSDENPPRNNKDGQEVTLHDQWALFSLELSFTFVEVVTGAHFACMAEANEGDHDCEGRIENEDQSLHRVDEGLLGLWDAARRYWPDRCQSVQNQTGDKNGEKLFSNVVCIIQICILSNLHGVIDVWLCVAFCIWTQIIDASLVPGEEVDEVGYEYATDGELCSWPPKIHPLSSCGFHFYNSFVFLILYYERLDF